MLAHATCIVAAQGKWDFADGRSVPYLDLIDTSGGGTFRVTLAEGMETPPVFASGEAHLEITSTGGDRPKLKAKLRAFQRADSPAASSAA